MATLLAQGSVYDATSYTITFDQASTPGSDVIVFAASAAVESFPVGWVTDYQFLDGNWAAVMRLPGAQNAGGIASIPVTAAAARSFSYVVVEDFVASVAYSEFTTSPDDVAAGGGAWGTGLHTFSSPATGFGDPCFAVFWKASFSSDPAVCTGMDNSYSVIGQTYSLESANEEHLLIVGHLDNGSFTNNGVTATLNPASQGGALASTSKSGMIVYSGRDSGAAATLSASVDPISLTAVIGATDQTTTTISASDTSGATVAQTDDAAWLTVTPASGAEPQAFTVTADATGQTAGVLNGSITFTAAGYADLVVPVSFTVTEQPALFGADLAAENALAGDGDEGYAPSVANGAVGYLGYAKQFSVNAGETIEFAVDGVSATDIAIYRLGGYDFTPANQQYKRLITTISNTGTDQSGTSATAISNGSGALAMNWATTASWAVPSSAISGMFIAVVRDSGGTGHSWIPFLVRQDARNADIVVKISDSTWGAAYNFFGDIGTEKTGQSLYGTSGNTNDPQNRSTAVSYDRPIVTRGVVVNHWDQYELPTIQWLESNGYDVKYISSYDLDQQGTNDVLGTAKILIHVGHDEYWSQGMRDNALAFAAAGGHQVWLTANQVFWRVRWADGGRTMYCYKDSFDDFTDPVSWTGTWRDSDPDGVGLPEDELSGTFFRLNGINEVTMTLAPGAYQASPFWRDTAVSAGSGLSLAILGFEVDEAISKPGGVLLADTDITANGNYANDDGDVYTGSATFTWGISMFRPVPAGGVSVGFGSMDWVRFLSAAARDGTTPSTDIQQSMSNLLYDMGTTGGSLDVALTEPTPVALTSYGVAPVPFLTDYHVSDGTNWWRVGSAVELESQIKAATAASVDFADFKNRIANL